MFVSKPFFFRNSFPFHNMPSSHNTLHQFKTLEHDVITNTKHRLKREKVLTRVENAKNFLKSSGDGLDGSSDDRFFVAHNELKAAQKELHDMDARKHKEILTFYSHTAKFMVQSPQPSRRGSHTATQHNNDNDEVGRRCVAPQKRKSEFTNIQIDGQKPFKRQKTAFIKPTPKHDINSVRLMNRVVTKSNLSGSGSGGTGGGDTTTHGELSAQVHCNWCGNENRVINHDTSYIQCNACGAKERFNDSGINSFPFGTDCDTSAQGGYQRRSHLGGIFKKNLFGSKQPINEKREAKVVGFITKKKLDVNTLNIENMDTIYRCLGMEPSFFEGMNILCKLRGVRHPGQDKERLKMLEHCFLVTEKTFISSRDIVETDRNNFTYYPTIRLTAIMLGYDDIVPLFPPLITFGKREKASVLLKLIWEKNQWEFFDTDVTIRNFVGT